MFSSQSRKAYQQIGDDYDDEALRNSTCTSRFMQGFGSSTRSILFGNQERNGEHQSLIASSSSQHSYHDSPADAPPEVHYEQFHTGGHGPPTMASSSQATSRRWDHISNLDEFFCHIYEYHQFGGFLCIAMEKAASLIQFIFIMSFTTFFTQCVDYPFLFADTNVTTSGTVNIGKRHFGDAIYPSCASQFSIWVVFAILAAIVYWITRIIKHSQYVMKMSEMQQFYLHELKITDNQLMNMTWHSIVKRLMEASKRLRLSIHQETLTPDYIYHRILRYRNYMIGMVNKRVLYPVFDVPFVGPIAYLPNNLKTEIERILFHSSTSAWENGPNLKDEFKHHEQLEIATKKMADDCKFYGFLSLILMPLMVPFQIMESFFSLAELIKRRPDGLGMRRYSNYGRYMVRHFNELDHELNARLNRSHIYADAYMNQFFSPVLVIVAKNITFMAASVVVVLSALSAWDEDVLSVEHVLTTITISGLVILVFRGMIPDENLVWQPEVLMTHVASELHYLPSEWKGKAHTTEVRHQFDQLFQMKWMFFILELTSPLFTPFVLLFWLRPRCSELANFFHDYTERKDGLGDVCSFAIMDVNKHGDPKWNLIKELKEETLETDATGVEPVVPPVVTSHNRAQDGKTELSILHFKTTNPEWQPPPASDRFLRRFRTRLGQEASQLAPITSTYLGRPHPEHLDQAVNLPRNVLLESVHSIVPTSASVAPGRHPLIGEGLHRIDGPLENAFQGIQGKQTGGVLASLYQEQPRAAESLSNSLRASGIDVDGAGAEMRINALFLRGLHDESVVQNSRHYGSTFNPMQSVFAMPDGFGRPAESLIDVEAPAFRRETHQKQPSPKSLEVNIPGTSSAPAAETHHPEPLAELADLPGPAEVSGAVSDFQNAPRASRLPMETRQINEEEEEEEDDTPPLSFSS